MENPKIKHTAHEISRELVKMLERERNGNALRWAVFTELRLGTGFKREWGVRHYERKLSALKQKQRRGDRSHDGIPISEAIVAEQERVAAARRHSDRRESRIDVFALDCWPSRNYERRAYEIKVDRGDLNNELKNPDKRAPWLEIVNAFYFVVPRELCTVAEIAERAPECGLVYYKRKPDRPDTAICTCGNKTRVREWEHSFGCDYKDALAGFERGRVFSIVKAPIKLDGAEPSWGLVASVLRSAARA